MGVDAQERESLRLGEAIRPLLAGKAPAVQGAALADLLALWLAGHVLQKDDGEVDDKATRELRLGLLKQHCAVVEELIPLNFAMRVEPELERRKKVQNDR